LILYNITVDFIVKRVKNKNKNTILFLKITPNHISTLVTFYKIKLYLYILTNKANYQV